MKRSILFLLITLAILVLEGKAQSYPENFYELSADGKTLIFWKGDTTIVNLATDTQFARVETIADYAFARRDTLGNVIPDYTIEQLILPFRVKQIGYMSFWCRNLRSLHLNEGLIRLNEYSVCEAPLTSIAIPSSVMHLEGAFYRCKDIEKITVAPESNYYYVENGMLINKTTASLSMYPAGQLTATPNLPPNIHSIAPRSFCAANYLIRATIPEGVEQIGEAAFSECLSLRSIVFPSTLKRIANNIFIDSPADTLIFKSIIPPNIKGELKYTQPLPRVIVVPDEAITTYQNNTSLKKFAEKIIPLSELANNEQLLNTNEPIHQLPFYLLDRNLVLSLPEGISEARLFNKDGALKAIYLHDGSYPLTAGIYMLLIGKDSYKIVVPDFAN